MENFPNKGVAVVIPVYNRAKVLQETLDYVLSQTLLPDKLIVVDDGSTDDTANQTEMWLSDHAGEVDWKLIRNPKSTAAKARNVGFSQIGSADYVAFLDSDDHWPPDFLERCVQMLETQSDAVAAIAERRYHVLLDESPQPAGGLDMISDPITWIFKNGGGITSCALLRSEIVHEIGGWPEKPPGEDSELFCLMSLKGSWAFAEGAPVVFNIGNAADKKEEVNLSRKYTDRDLRWASRFEDIYERIISEDSSINSGSLRVAMARRWNRAWRHQTKMGEWHEAWSCIRRAIYWDPYNWKYLRHSIKTFFRK